MPKVFRLYSGGNNAYQGWQSSPAFPYNSIARNTISDPAGASPGNEITSIPSPFARIDLVKTAFKEVCQMATNNINMLDGNTIFHKMVSDSLDVGEIFFNIDKYKGIVDIITWDYNIALNALRSDGDAGHGCIADALQKYMVSDAQTYNFGDLQNIYLLNYTNGPQPLNIIGATSPATLFFSNANNLDYVNNIFFANNDRPFDSQYQPLYKRDHDYIEALWTLSRTIPNFPSLFPEIHTYLTLTYTDLQYISFKQKLNAITAADANNFDNIDVIAGQQNNQVEVLGNLLLKKKGGVRGVSQFTIKPERNADGTMPLVLPVEAGNKYAGLQYVNGGWGKTNTAPYKDSQSNISERTLPNDGSNFPYLTVSDFLEDNIVKVPHKLNEQYYYNGGINLKEDMASSFSNEMPSFLLPIKPLYFKYFSAGTLTSAMPDGKPAFALEALAGGSIRATIRIPIVGNGSISYIEYQRIYYKDNQPDVSEDKNDGGMKLFDFTGLVMPSMRFQNDADAMYTVACVSTFSKKFKLSFYNGGEIIHDVPVDCRNTIKGEFDYKAETYTLRKHNFDFIRVSDESDVSGMLVPVFKEYNGLDDFEFAVDLGTSNTHIEYKKDGDTQSKPFGYEASSEAMISHFFNPTVIENAGMQIEVGLEVENGLIEADFIPKSMGMDKDYKFPTRTALSNAKSTDWKKKLNVFGLVNFNETYNKRNTIPYNAEPLVNIKWSNDVNAQSAVQAFINNIMLLIRNKVVANNGSISGTKIKWFYPNSMSPRRLSQLKTAWDTAYAEFFNTNGATKDMSESVAPIKFYFRRYATATDLVNVDIGGGTTDIAFSSNGNVNYTTSFKFAANALFEDSLSDINPHNGIVDYFKESIHKLLVSGAGMNELRNIYEKNIERPANMASFLFSLRDNSKTNSLDANSIDLNRILLNDTKFKLVFIIFYTAIIYHIAQIVKVKGMKSPRHIAFSGNGSKILNVISTDPKILSKYTKSVFEKVLGVDYGGQLDILGLEHGSNPKEYTCKGGLITAEQAEDEPENIIMKDSAGHLVNASDTYATIGDREKKDIINSVEKFFSFVLNDMPRAFNFDKNFGVENITFSIAREVCREDLDTYLDKGLKLSVKESGNINNPIEDALSFYPIKGVLQALSEKINSHFKENNNQ